MSCDEYKASYSLGVFSSGVTVETISAEKDVRVFQSLYGASLYSSAYATDLFSSGYCLNFSDTTPPELMLFEDGVIMLFENGEAMVFDGA